MIIPFPLQLTPEQRSAQRLQAELAAIAERREQAKRTNKAAIALFHDMRRAGAHIGRVQGRDTSGRFAADDAE